MDMVIYKFFIYCCGMGRQLSQLESSPAYILFISSLRSKATKLKYADTLNYFIKFFGSDKTCEDLLEVPAKQIQALVIQFIVNMRDERKLAPNTIRLRTSALQAFFSINDIEGINWKKVKKFQGEFYKVAEDRPYTREEITKLLNVADIRNKAIILLFSSSGIRVGGLTNLQLKHLKPFNKYNLFMIEVYKKSKEHYVTFCTPECRKAIEEYLGWRKKYGEKLTPESPLFRKEFNRYESKDIRVRVRPITNLVISNMLRKIRLQAGIVENQPITETVKQGSARTEIMSAHGFRKYFATMMETEGVNPVYVELLLGHDVGLKTVYSRPTALQLLEGNGDKVRGYTAGINALTIDEANRLMMENKSLHSKLERFVQIQMEIDGIHKELALIRGQKIEPV
ncbi:MAG: tyrosine-type recombinase/integrase [Nitrososphaeraceae archaeon]|nr:tyrosine-type recombinase/integrase [Nitrososphaeraceae archaeon]